MSDIHYITNFYEEMKLKQTDNCEQFTLPVV